MVPGFGKQTITIGSDPSCDVILGGVEPRHAEIVHQGVGKLVFVNGSGATVAGGRPLGPSEQVPFDSISKALALREGTVPPGGDPVEVCEQWLGTSLGGTCWGHVSALGAVLGVAGLVAAFGIGVTAWDLWRIRRSGASGE